MTAKEKSLPVGDSLRARLNLRLIIIIPAIFILVSLSVGLLAMTLTQVVLSPGSPSSRELLILRLSIVASSLLAGFLGALLAYAITKPVRRAISEAQEMIRYVETNPPPIEAANEVQALTALFDQAYVSFVELVQAREMLDNANEGIMAIDRDGTIAGINLKAQEILGINSSDVRHKSLSDLFGQNPINNVFLAIADNAFRDSQERIHNRVPLSPPSGKEALLSLKVSPVRLKTGPREPLGAIIAFNEHFDRSWELPEVVGESKHFTQVLELVAKVAPTDSRVLITGESGTGKELIANAIHRLSQRKDRPFIKLNCAAIPEGLLESELFGHEKGAFTGAVSKKAGKFELANGGTIFLDEIGDMSPSAQAKVLRVLQEGEFTPVGGSQTKKVDVRIIAATNRDLFLEVQQGKFREDLFYRLNVITLNVPPLRERKSDIPFLAGRFLEEAAKRSNNEKKSLSRSAMDSLLAYSWPGNVRELENAIERAFLLSPGSVIQAEDLPISPNVNSVRSVYRVAATDAMNAKDSTDAKHASLNETLEAVERELIIQALKKSKGVQIEAAKLLGLNHKNLWHKIKKHNLDLSEIKNGRENST